MMKVVSMDDVNWFINLKLISVLLCYLNIEMVNKLLDAANFIKAKIKQDDLQQLLLVVTSQDNWQASTKQLHQVANAAHNYEKWQKINDFIWDKLRKSKSWKKILKTLTLIQFLLKNGPTSILSSFKYELYHFRSFESYSAISEGIDRGESIREKSKLIVQLLSNQQLLQEERQKAKTIKEKMIGVVGDRGSQYSGYSNTSSSKYQTYNNKTYDGNTKTSQFNGRGTYGDYNYQKSTLDKYKDSTKKNTTKDKEPQVKEEIFSDNKKPFEKTVPKLVKPGTKPTIVNDLPEKNNQSTKPNTSNSILDDDIFNVSTTPQTKSQLPNNTTNINQSIPTTTITNNTKAQQVNKALTQTNTQPNLIGQLNFNNPIQQYPQNNQFIQSNQFNNQFPNQFQHTNQFGQPNQLNQFYPNNNPNTFAFPPQQNIYQNQFYIPQPQSMPKNDFGYLGNLNQPQNIYQPNNQININKIANPISLQKNEQEFGSFQSANEKNNKVNWMSNQQKNLTDFSDFSLEIKKQTIKANTQSAQPSNNIKYDMWNW